MPPTERRVNVTPQLAARVAILGGVALAIFAAIFFRLWFLQILSGNKYLAQAEDNRIRDIRVEAPRGKIVDRNGSALVDNRAALAVQIEMPRLPAEPSQRRRILSRLGHVLGMSPRHVSAEIRQQLRDLPFGAVTLKSDVPLSTVYYLEENQDRFPGVRVERIFLRRYPKDTLGAHLFGTVGEITRKQLKQRRYEGVPMGDRVGQSGIEYAYDRYLRGRDGATRLQVDALGRPKGELRAKAPEVGKQLRLSVDLKVQKAAEQAIAVGAQGAAAVAMDIRSGEIVALASNPTFNPNVFAKRISESTYKQLTDPANGAPLTNRAISALLPTGSSFKPITATAALEKGLLTTQSVINDPGSLTVGGITFKNAGAAAHGAITLVPALSVSSDVFFYTLGLRDNANRCADIDSWAHRLGLGQRTGIDLPSETDGLVPSPDWRNRLFKKNLTDRPWSVGDCINLAVGQGDLQANPLQMAVAYSTIANGGRVVRPHLGLRVETPGGRTVQELNPAARRKLNINPEYRKAILAGMHSAATDPGGTSEPVFRGFPIPVAGKTGTAQNPGGQDHSWYGVLAPYPNPEIVVFVVIEHGGFGAEAAAPAARQILAAYFNVKGKKAGARGTAPD